MEFGFHRTSVKCVTEPFTVPLQRLRDSVTLISTFVLYCQFHTTHRRRTRRCRWSWRRVRRCRRPLQRRRRRRVVDGVGEGATTRRETSASARPRPRWTRSRQPGSPTRRHSPGSPARHTARLNAASSGVPRISVWGINLTQIVQLYLPGWELVALVVLSPSSTVHDNFGV